MAEIYPNKNFRFKVFISGIETAEIESFTPPEVSSEQVEHGYAGDVPNGKTPGKPAIGNATMVKYVQVNRPEYDVYQWYVEAQADPRLGKRTVRIEERNALQQVARVWIMRGVYPITVTPTELNTMNSENIKETVELSVDRYQPAVNALAEQLFNPR